MADNSKITKKQLNAAMTKVKKYADGLALGGEVTRFEPVDDDIPKVFFNGDKPTTKDSVYATIEYISKTKHFKG